MECNNITTLTATSLVGTITAQPNITSVGTLTSLVYLDYFRRYYFNCHSLAGSISTAAQPNTHFCWHFNQFNFIW
jgi:hypothetical protein